MHSQTSNKIRWNSFRNCVAGVFIIVIIFITLKYYFVSGDTEWTVYPREWSTVEDDAAAAKTFTHMTYNILCDGMMRSNRHKYSDCDSNWLNLNIRQSRLLKEVETMNPDVLCVQEIDKKWYQNFWYPQLSLRGYDGVDGLTEVKNEFTAGQAIFWKKDVFRKTMHEHHLFHDLLKPFIERSVSGPQAEEMYQFYTRRNLLLWAELMELSSRSKVIVGCPHFAHRIDYEPSAQVLQAGLSLQHLEKVSNRRGTPAIIFSGDLSAPPKYPMYDFIKQGRLTDDIKQKIMDTTDFANLDNDLTKYAIEVTKLVPDAFHHDLQLKSAYENAMGEEPDATDLGGTTRDYIWYTPDYLIESGVLVVPSEFYTDILPNRRGYCAPEFASDHLPLATKFRVK